MAPIGLGFRYLAAMYRALNPQKVTETIQRLEKRIGERFPESSLRRVCLELEIASKEADARSRWIEKPIWYMRLGLILVLLLAVLGIVASIHSLPLEWGKFSLGEMLQIAEATTNEIVLIGAALFSLFTLEARLKRARALRALYELRSIAHVIDMHQLTKDPSRNPNQNTQNSPKVPLTHFEMIRYLDYCSEMLSLVGKVSGIFAQVSRDEVVLNVINEVESLTSNLSFEVWQKISIIYAEEDREKQEEARLKAAEKLQEALATHEEHSHSYPETKTKKQKRGKEGKKQKKKKQQPEISSTVTPEETDNG